MHKPNPAKFFVSLYFQYLKTFHVYLYLELSKFFLPIAIRKLENRLFPKFSRENQPVLSLGITSPLIWKLIIEIAIQTSQAVFFLRENNLNKGVNNKSVSKFNTFTHRKHRCIGIMEYVKLRESRDRTVTSSHKLRFGKTTGYLLNSFQLVNILVYSTRSMGQKSSNQYHQFKNCPVYQTMKSLDLILCI